MQGVLLDPVTGKPEARPRIVVRELPLSVRENLAHAGVLRFLGLPQPENFDAHKNFAYSTVATAPSPASSGTSLVVAAGDGSKFPAAPFNATVWPSGAQPTDANAEIVRVIAVATDTFTITRAQESSSARAIGVGDQIGANITAKTLTDIEGAAGSPLTTKGDIHGFSTVDARVPVGSNGQVLQADSTQALGVAWASLAGTGLVHLYETTLGATGALDTGASAIPTGHGHLIVYILCRAAGASNTDGYSLRVNGDTGANYDLNYSYFGSAASSGAVANGTSWTAAGVVTANSNTANYASLIIIEFPFYDNTNWNRMGRMFMSSQRSSSRTVVFGLGWNNTAAINQITLDTTSANHFLANSTMIVYGTK